MNVARIYLRVSTDEQDLTRQADIEQRTRASGYYVAGVYREKASGARADRTELLRLIADLQPGEVVVAEKIDRISRLPLPEAERLVDSIRAKGARRSGQGRVAARGASGPWTRSSTPVRWRYEGPRSPITIKEYDHIPINYRDHAQRRTYSPLSLLVWTA